MTYLRAILIMGCCCSVLQAKAQGLRRQLLADTPYARLAPAQPTTLLPATIPPAYYTTQLGFFCRQELKMQQARIPILFRVGTVDQCNTLEQKPGYR